MTQFEHWLLVMNTAMVTGLWWSYWWPKVKSEWKK